MNIRKLVILLLETLSLISCKEDSIVGYSFYNYDAYDVGYQEIYKIVLNRDYTWAIFVNEEAEPVSSGTFTIDKSERTLYFYFPVNDETSVGFYTSDMKTLTVDAPEGHLTFTRDKSGRKSKSNDVKQTDTDKITTEVQQMTRNRESINIAGITINSTPTDLLLLYPQSDIFEGTYTVYNIEGFDEIDFSFDDTKLTNVQEKLYDDTAEMLQKTVTKLASDYGKPIIWERSYYDYEIKMNVLRRDYTWEFKNDIIIEIQFVCGAGDGKREEYFTVDYSFY